MNRLILAIVLNCFLALSLGQGAESGINRSPKELLPFEEGDTLEEVRYKIDYNGYDFTVKENWVTRLTPEEKAELLSRHAPIDPLPHRASDDIGPLADLMNRQALPSSFDWRSNGGVSYVNSVRDQGNCGACYAFGAVAAFEGAYNIAHNLTGGSRLEFSEAFIAFCLDNHYSGFTGCSGSDYDYEELDALVDYGDCLLSTYPFPSSAYNTGVDPSCPFGAYPSTTKITSWHRIPCNDVVAIKTAIYNYGPVDAAVYVGSAFSGYSGGIYSDTSTSCSSSPCYYTPTNHVIALVGWVDTSPTAGYWILRNSWGTSWGENGYMRISYQAARVACEACYLVVPGGGSSSYYRAAAGDYNGDGYDDIAVYRPSTRQWRIRNQSNVYFGQDGDYPIPGDYNGNGTTDLAIYRPSTGLWKIRNRSNVYFGTSADQPVQADYNGDGTCDLAYFRPSTTMWRIRNETTFYFGTSSDTMVPADYDGDGSDEPAYFRPSSALWKYRDGPTIYQLYFGQAGDTPVPGDYDNDGTDEVAYFRPSSSLWKINGFSRYYFGNSSIIPIIGDFNTYWGDDLAYFDPSTTLWKVRNYTRCYFGQSSDLPVTR